MHRISLKQREECCGCTACSCICPTNAIVMTRDKEGFVYPYIIEEKCIHCGQCANVCQMDIVKKHDNPIKILATYSKKADVRMASSSGGVFSSIANFVEHHNGVIYGASFTEEFCVVHKRAEKREEWEKFRTSKYVQSDLRNTFSQIKNDLINKKMVLFVGTPCQVEGLNLFLQGKYIDNLITCDIVCHGVPSPQIWEDYLRYIIKLTNKRIVRINFRDKKQTGWHNSTLTLRDDADNIIIEETQDINFFMKMFFNHLILRPSCYSCKFANMYRVGDITLGDFWGIEKSHPEMDDNKGTSLVMINTKKGKDVFEQIETEFGCKEVNEKDCLQPNLCKPSLRPESREVFWRAYYKRGLVYAGKQMNLLPITKLDKAMRYIDRSINKISKILNSR